MSQMELHVGRAVKVKCGSADLEELSKIICEERFISLDFYDTWEEAILCELGEEYAVINGVLYKVEDASIEEGTCTATENADGSISYTLHYYNGGCGFNEALEDAVNEILREVK